MDDTKLPTITPKSTTEAEGECLKCVSTTSKVESQKNTKKRFSSSKSKTFSNNQPRATISADFDPCRHQSIDEITDTNQMHLTVSRSARGPMAAPYENPSLVVLGFEELFSGGSESRKASAQSKRKSEVEHGRQKRLQGSVVKQREASVPPKLLGSRSSLNEGRLPDAVVHQKQINRQRLSMLSKLGLSTARNPNTWQPFHRIPANMKEKKQKNNESIDKTMTSDSHPVQSENKFSERRKSKDKSRDDSSQLQARSSRSTAELIRKVKRHQEELRRERRRQITGSTKPRPRVRSSYLQMLEQRQEFRKTLVRLLRREDRKKPGGADVLQRRYYYFISRGVSMVTSPLQKSWITRILNLVPRKLRLQSSICQNLIQQLCQDYEKKMRKVAIDFVLNSGLPRKRPIQETKKQSTKSQNVYLTPIKLSIRKHLHLLNPCILATLQLWNRDYMNLRLVDIETVVKDKDSIELEDLICGAEEGLEKSHETLQQWFKRSQTIFYKGFQVGQMPGFNQPSRLASFCHAAVTVMTHNLQQLCILSLCYLIDTICSASPRLNDRSAKAIWSLVHQESESIITEEKATPGESKKQDNVSNCHEEELQFSNNDWFKTKKILRLKLHLLLSGKKVVFQPTFSEIEEKLLSLVDKILEVSSSMPRLETKLFAEWKGREGNMEPIICEKFVECLRQQLRDELRAISQPPAEYSKRFMQYELVIGGQAEEEVNNFLTEQHAFEEYTKKIAEFSYLKTKILTSSEHIVELGTYELHCKDLIDALVTRVSGFRRDLLGHLHTIYVDSATQLVGELREITGKALSTPGDTLELMRHKSYMQTVMQDHMPALQKRIYVLHNQLQFLAEHMSLSSEECNDAIQPLIAFTKLPDVFSLHLQIITEKRAEYESSLKERRERFKEELAEYAVQLEEFQNLGEASQLNDYLKKARSLYNALDRAAAFIDQINKEEEALSWATTHYPTRKQVSDKLAPFLKLYEVGVEWQDRLEEWLHSQVGTHDPDTISQEVAATWRTVYKLEKVFVDVPAAKDVVIAVRQRIEQFRENLPLVQTLGNPGLKERHWEKISEIVGYPLRADPATTLQRLIDSNLEDYLSKFEMVSEAASKEHVFEKNLEKMKAAWQEMDLVLKPHRETETYVLTGVEDIQLLLDDHIVKTQSMRSSPFIKPIEEEVASWESTLSTLQEVVDEWLRVQNTWIYLEPIFGSPDIMAQMPEEGRRFNTVDKTWRDIMKSMNQNTRVLAVLEVDKILERLKKASELLELIQRGLNEYLEKKRLFFARFFFLSNEELLEILSETKDPSRVQPHLKKCFEGVSALDFGDDLDVVAVRSSEGEVITLSEVISTSNARGQVEKWLVQLEAEVRSSIKRVVNACLKDYSNKPREKWVLEWPGQAILCVSQTFWTSEVSKAMREGMPALQTYFESCNEQIETVVALVRGKLSKQNRTTLGALVVLDVHSRDVLKDEIIRKKITTENSFTWLAQLRYYWKEGSLKVRMINAELNYGYEYLGNTGRLVITSLTDRCYRTLTQALNLHLGGAPEGPAGTGKTETTKDLAKAVAKQCVVFNCSDGLDYISLAKFFKGLASCGAWTCFDEFNRIELEVLSVVAQQILTLQRSIQSGLPTLSLHGSEVTLDPTCAIFITMNPTYAGRSDLPDNLKALFRSVAMMVPDYGLIAEISLYSYGFVAARTMSRKIVATYRLCSEQLSTQPHYDYGMRTVKAVLVAAGNLKLKQPELLEAVVVLRSIKDVNLPKFLAHDLPLFQEIISDLFKDVVLPEPDYTYLMKALKEACAEMNLRPNSYFLGKIQQVYETMKVRHGFMLIGNPIGGKTMALKTLAKALSFMNERGEGENKVQMTVINPKSISPGQLYGQFDPVSHEWSDGVLAVTFRKYATSSSSDRKWIILDGPVDSVWIENINSVLDDNKKLCLNSGEIICLSETTTIIFEVNHLENASPATVSRCGMVYLEPMAMGWRPLVEAWLSELPKTLTQQHKAVLTALFHRFVPPLLTFVRRNLHWLKLERTDYYVQKDVSPTTDLNLVISLMNIFDCFANEFSDPAYTKHYPETDIRAHLESIFLFSLIWSLGGPLDEPERKQFDVLLRQLFKGEPDKELRNKYSFSKIPPPPFEYQLPIPEDDTVFDYKFVKEGRGYWQKWAEDLANASSIPRDVAPHQILVPTVKTVRVAALLNLLVAKKGVPILLVGPPATGKSCYIMDFLNKLKPDAFKPLTLSFSAQTSSTHVQDLVMAGLDKRKKGVYGPPIGKKCVMFIDDVSLPQPDEFSSHPPIELLRQMINHATWYHISKEVVPINLEDMQIICAMSLRDSGKISLTPRFLRHFNIIAVNDFDDATISSIYSKILLWHLDTRGFSKMFDPCIKEMVNGTLEVYRTTATQLRPTPSRAHYIFNLRDYSRVIQGVLLSVPETMGEVSCMKQLWVHEIFRVFYDRLIDSKDRTWLLEVVASACATHLNTEFNELMANLIPDGEKTVRENDLRNLVYCDFSDPKSESRPYIPVNDMEGLRGVVESYLQEFNNMSKKPMNLVMFNFALEHLCRISRVLRQPRGHALLVGVGGSGRHSLTRLAAHIADYDLFEEEEVVVANRTGWYSRMVLGRSQASLEMPFLLPYHYLAVFICDSLTQKVEMSRTYGLNEWREDLKALMRKAGLGEQHIIFLFGDTQVKYEVFLEDVASLASTGEVAGLFVVDEKHTLCDKMRNIDRQRDKSKQTDGSTTALWNLFIERVQEQLHLVIAMSPCGDDFRMRLRRFPSILSCCSIDWFQSWPPDALEAVAVRLLKDVDIPENTKKGCVTLCQYFHTSTQDLSESFLSQLGRHNYVTPTSYLQLLHTYMVILGKRRAEVRCQEQRYTTGLSRLREAETSVWAMQQELVNLQPVLLTKTKEVEEKMAIVEKRRGEVAEVERVVRQDEEVANEAAEAANGIRRECEAELNLALPLLEEATDALNTIKQEDIVFIKAMKNPPSGVKIVLEAICVLLGEKPDRIPDPQGTGKMVEDYWAVSKRILGDIKFKENLLNFDKDNIDQKAIQTIRTKYRDNSEFLPEKIQQASKAAESLCKWVLAMERYEEVDRKVAPKREALRKADKQYQSLMGELRKKQEALRGVQEELAGLQAELDTVRKEKMELEQTVELCSIKKDRAEQLLAALGGEKTRWTENAESLAKVYINLTGDVLLASGVIAYLGAFTPEFRSKEIAKWLKECRAQNVPCSHDFSLATTLGDPLTIRDWTLNGLPTDPFSIDNGVIINQTTRWPLLIDPQGQANKWIRNMEKENSLHVLKFTDSDFIRNLENCVQFGQPILLENVREELDPILEPLLLKQTFKQSGSTCIKIGDSTIEYSSEFRMYLTTKLSNPDYVPEVSVKVTLVNFALTAAGLEDQLLALVVAHERPELEEERVTLMLQTAQNKKNLKELEDKILCTLSSSQGSILEDETAINVLSDAKRLVTETLDKQTVADETEQKIEATRLGYRPVAVHASILFFTLQDLSALDPMYQFSLGWFINLFSNSIDHSEKASDLLKRLQALKSHFTRNLYSNVCIGLFEKDKLLFSFLMCVNLQRCEGKIDNQEWLFLLTGGVALSGEAEKNPAPGWLPEQSWQQVRIMKSLPGLQSVAESFTERLEDWKVFAESENPQREDIPRQEGHPELSRLQKLCLLRCLRPDKVVPGVLDFVADLLGKTYIEPPPFDLARTFSASNSCMPLIFLLTPGADPSSLLLKFSEDNNMGGEKTQIVSLGQGQGPIALKLVEDGIKMGTWVLLQNCHLAKSFMPTLEKVCEELNPETTHPDFRLWLTSYPSSSFPVSVLQNSLKMVTEAPKGIKANLKRLYMSDPLSEPDYLTGANTDGRFRRLVFAVSFFHAVVQERRLFGPLGWNVPYSFSDTDLRISVLQLKNLLALYKEVPWEALLYLTAECNYGGKVTDERDRRTLATLLERFYCPNVLNEHEYSFDQTGGYLAPPDGDHAMFISHIEELPRDASPKVFGMNSNANIMKDQAETNKLFSAVLRTQSSLSAGGQDGDSKVDITGRTCEDILARIPKLFNVDAALEKYPTCREQSLNTVLLQEMCRYNTLNTTITTSLQSVLRALSGSESLTEETEEVLVSIRMGRVPSLWKSKSYPTLKSLGSYISDLCQRLDYLQKWFEDGIPAIFWISGLFFTQSFLTAILQNHARVHGIPIDQLWFDFLVMQDVRDGCDSPNDGTYIKGIFLEGAIWDSKNQCLEEAPPRKLTDIMPPIWLKPMIRSEIPKRRCYSCPLYTTSERKGELTTTGHHTNYVISVGIPSRVEEHHWVLRGVALLLSLTD